MLFIRGAWTIIMKPVINPWIFYLVKVSEGISNIAGTVLLTVGIITTVAFFMCAVLKIEGYSDEDKELKNAKGILKKLVLSFGVLSAVYIFIPSKETYYQMIISSQVTIENVQKVEEVIKDSVDYIIEKMN